MNHYYQNMKPFKNDSIRKINTQREVLKREMGHLLNNFE